MKSPKISKEILGKVNKVSAENFQKYKEELGEMDSKELFKVAYLHGYNTSHTIYDIAEERAEINSTRWHVPEKDNPTISFDSSSSADRLFHEKQFFLSNMEKQDIYVSAYREGFETGWYTSTNKPMDGKLTKLTDYYLFGKR